MSTQLFQSLAISLLLGGLVGLQRQHVDSPLGGVRTFPLVAIFGSLCAILAAPFGGWMVAAGLLATVVVIALGSWQVRSEEDRGITSEAAILVMFAVGALCVSGPMMIAVAVGAGVAVLLQFKPQLHGIVTKLGDADIKAIMQFVLITFIVLPVLPNETYDPFEVLNPHEIWLMVVLVVGISLGGYISYRFLGHHAGLILSGLLGGIISSTATTASYARRTAQQPAMVPTAATVICLATGVSFIRILLEVAVVSRTLLPTVAPVLIGLMVVSLLFALVYGRRGSQPPEKMPSQGNPSELKSAILFGGLYGLVLISVAASKEYLSHTGLYAIAMLSGLADLDAITLSTARMVESQRLSVDSAWRIILIAALSNLVFKAGLVLVLGDRKLFRDVAWLLGMSSLLGASVLWWWR
ncbi:MAG: MgtC/SapB family protein [Planctomycetaceae bacterium]|nr:MgtC/SapB family protein [Planctomycetaceae bacterium]